MTGAANSEEPNLDTAAVATTAGGVPPRSPRIPKFLQQVFIESNQGNEVHKPPPCGLASKTFLRNRIRRLNSGIFRSDSFRSLFGRSDSNKSVEKVHVVVNKNQKPTISSCERGGSGGDEDDCGKTTIMDSSSHPDDGPKNKSSISSSDTNQKQETEISPLLASLSACSSCCSPQTFLDSLIRLRGYTTQRFRTLNTAYSNKPTALQLASYNVYLIKLLREHDIETFRAVMTSGISPNPCNKWGESLVHTICRRGEAEFLKIMIKEAHTVVQVADDQGRTPLHDACWSSSQPSFETIKLLLACDVTMLYLTDAHGATPLSYVRTEHYKAWISFLQQHADLYWPVTLAKTTNKNVHQRHADTLFSPPPPPTRTQLEPNSLPIPDPERVLSLEMAAQVSAGKITPAQAEYLCYNGEEEEEEEEESDDSNDEDSGDDDDDDDDESAGSSDCSSSSSDYSMSSTSSDISWDEQEMADIVQSLGVFPKAHAKPMVWSH